MIKDRRKRRHLHIRHRAVGTTDRPRLCVHRSNRHIQVQLVDDSRDKVLAGASSLSPGILSQKLNPMEASKAVGKMIADQAKELGVSKVVFDRAGYRYHGRVKAVAEAAREGGLEF